MSTTKHTPGPWRFSTDSGTVGQAKLNGVEVIAVIEAPPLGTNKWDTDALLANGSIIAAAPDMLELIEQQARGYCPSCGCDLCNTAGCSSCTWMRAARKLLARLDGTVYAEPPILPADEINKRNSRLGEKK